MEVFGLQKTTFVRLLVATLTAIPSTNAFLSTPTKRDYCVQACNTVVGSVIFADAQEDYYLNQCTSPLFIESLSLCTQQYCTEGQLKSGLDFANNTCVLNAGVPFPSFDAFKRSSSELDEFEKSDAMVGLVSFEEPLDYPIIPTEEWYQLGYRTMASNYDSYNLGWSFSWAMYGFWALVIFSGISYRVADAFISKRQAVGCASNESKGAWGWIRKRLILSATFGKSCQAPVGWCTIPTRLESILLALYFVMNFIFLFVGYDVFSGNLWYPTSNLQLSRWVSDRAGFLSIAQLPLVWLFAARNDPLLWITGWSFATYSRFHRWVARICVLHAVIHSIGYSLYTYYAGGGSYATSWQEEYWYCGAIATVVMSLTLGASFYVFRVKAYDLFLITHIILAVISLVGLWYHVRNIANGDFNGFVWPCVAIWALDRLLRIGRVVYFGLLPRFSKGQKAIATYNESAEIVRLDISNLLPSKEISPGHYYYLYAPGQIRGYESHPFTLCTWRQPALVDKDVSSPVLTMEDDKTSESIHSAGSISTGEMKQSLLIRPYKGFTNRLKTKIMVNSTSASEVTVFLEGPYGSKVDLTAFSDVLIIAGGSGITAAISHTNHLLPTNQTSVQVAWAVQQTHLVEDVCENELKEATSHPRFSIDVYCTRQKAETPSKMASGSAYSVHQGRPDMEAVVREARRNCTKDLAVVTCGPPRMADQCRVAVVAVLEEGGPNVQYFNEALGW